MKILRTTYERFQKRKVELSELIDDAKKRKNTASAEGDLSENADYLKALSDLELYTEEYGDVLDVIETGEPVEETTVFTEIDVGCRFNIDVKLIAKPLTTGSKNDIGVFEVEDITEDNSTLLRGVVVMGGPSNNYVYEGIISTESVVGRSLLGKPLGRYTMNNAYGETLEVVASPC